MAWLCEDQEGDELVFNEEPTRFLSDQTGLKYWWHSGFITKDFRHNPVSLPSGSIQKLIGRELTWEDSPVEI